LDVQNNPLSSLQGVGTLKQLENLWASNCKLSSFADLENELKDKEQLSEVYFEGNPLQTQNEVLYRNKVRLALPQVTKIDASKKCPQQAMVFPANNCSIRKGVRLREWRVG